MTKIELARKLGPEARTRAQNMRATAARIRRQQPVAATAEAEAEAKLRDEWAEEDDLAAEVFEDAVRFYESKEEETI